MTLSLASVTPDEALHSDLEPPVGLKIDVRGLPPKRAELAKLIAWRDSILSGLEILSAGRRDLADHIRKLEREVEKVDSDTASSADSVLARIKQGLPWTIVPSSKPPPNFTKELQIASSALAKLDSEAAMKEALVGSLDQRITAAGRRAIHEHAEGVKNAYEHAVEELRERAAQLISLHRLTGGHEGRVCFDIPNFTGRHEFTPIRIEESHIAANRATWTRLMATWHSDPHAEPKLAFPKYDPSMAEELIYHERSATERAIIDAEFSAVKPLKD